LTNPDGSYRIDGLTPGTYQIYAHPLPPPLSGERFPANIFPPKTAEGMELPWNTAFETIFFPGVKDPAAASFLVVQAGAVTETVNFSVRRRAAPSVYAVET